MIISNRTLADFSNGWIFNEEDPKVRSKVHTKTSNPSRSSNQPTKLKVKVKMTKSASHHGNKSNKISLHALCDSISNSRSQITIRHEFQKVDF